MKIRLNLFLRYFLFWFGYFLLARTIFFLANFTQTSNLLLEDQLLSFLHGSRMDLSMTGYLSLIFGICLAFSSLVKLPFRKFLDIYTFVLLLISSLLVFADAKLYANWGFRMDSTPLMYIDKPREVIGSAGIGITVFLMILLILFAFLCFWFYKKLVFGNIILEKTNWKSFMIMLILSACLILPIRGSLGVAPMNIGFVYFHANKPFVNHAAINIVWNVCFSVLNSEEIAYPTGFFEEKQTQKLFSELYPDDSLTENVLKIAKPNIILIILEGYSSKLMQNLGGKSGISNNLERISKEGILFNHIYSNGDRTDKGIVSILSGYPAQPTSSIIKFAKKTQKLPYLSIDLKKNGYNTQFLFGGDINFANMRSYFTNAQFDILSTETDFADSLRNSKWGVHDGFVFDKMLAEIEKTPAPFFKTMLTLSSHEPYDVPMKTAIEGNSEEARFLNSAYYTDQCVGNFIEKAKKTSWWASTWVIILADHGNRHPNESNIYESVKYEIPMIWTGGAINKTDSIVQKYGSQSDLARTILRQLNMENKDFLFSKNLLSPKSLSHAFFTFNNGFGFLSDSSKMVFDNDSQKMMHGKNNDFGRAYLQKLYLDFNAL
ncbi:MAG: LTA synthase family protein [Bacteroidetes bacterium]|nr:MAG: LTA synthase family protein [Bacteroidota bacterium]